MSWMGTKEQVLQSTDYINYNVYIKHGHKFKHGLDDLYKDDSPLLATTLKVKIFHL